MSIAAGKWPECRSELADRLQGVPLPVGGPPARYFIFHPRHGRCLVRSAANTRANCKREALPMNRQIAGAKRFQCTVLGVLGVLGVSAKALVPRSGQAPTPASGKLPFIPSRFQLAGRPQGISFSGGRTRTPETPRTPKTWQMLGAKRCQYTRQLQARSATHGPANRRCEALPMHRPGCLGCPGCLGQGSPHFHAPPRWRRSIWPSAERTLRLSKTLNSRHQ